MASERLKKGELTNSRTSGAEPTETPRNQEKMKKEPTNSRGTDFMVKFTEKKTHVK